MQCHFVRSIFCDDLPTFSLGSSVIKLWENIQLQTLPITNWLRSKSNYKYRRRNKSGGDPASPDTLDNDAYWRKRRQNILQSLEALESKNSCHCTCNGSNRSSSSCSSTTPLTKLNDDIGRQGCSCKRINCQKCRISPLGIKSPDSPSSCNHKGMSHQMLSFSLRQQSCRYRKPFCQIFKSIVWDIGFV